MYIHISSRFPVTSLVMVATEMLEQALYSLLYTALVGADYKTAAVKLSRIYCKGQIVSKN